MKIASSKVFLKNYTSIENAIAALLNPDPDGDAATIVQNIITRNASTSVLDSDGTSGDNFGLAVAAYGDTYVVGSPNEDGSIGGINPTRNNSSSNTGAVFVYTRSGDTLTLQATIKSPSPGVSHAFGSWVDIDQDTIIVGEHSTATLCHVYTRTAGVWSLQQTIDSTTESNHTATDLAVSGQISGDLIIVGCAQEDSSSFGVNGAKNNSASESGCAYVFSRSGGVWTSEAFFKPQSAVSTTSRYFGLSVAISGNTAVVGSFGDDPSGISDAGQAYVFVKSGGAWSYSQTLSASNAGSSDYFGYTVAIEDDIIAVGAVGEDSTSLGVNSTPNDSGSAVGAVYLFERSGGVFSQTAYVKPTVRVDNSMGFGYSLDINAGIVSIAAPLETGTATNVNGNQSTNDGFNRGAIYCFRKISGTWQQVLYLKSNDGATSERFGGMGSYFTFPRGKGVACCSTGIIIGAYLATNGRARAF